MHEDWILWGHGAMLNGVTNFSEDIASLKSSKGPRSSITINRFC
jgi:hypothetical protein